MNAYYIYLSLCIRFIYLDNSLLYYEPLFSHSALHMQGMDFGGGAHVAVARLPDSDTIYLDRRVPEAYALFYLYDPIP